MDSYFILWPNDWCKSLAQANDYGPLQVIYGGSHTSVPSLGKIKSGDIIYPVSIKNGQLFVIGSMQVERIIDATIYLTKQAINRIDNDLWDTTAPRLIKERPDLGHRIPRSCVDTAATGSGTGLRFDFQVPTEAIDELRFGPKAEQEKGLSRDKAGRLSHVSLQGHFRRLSTDSAALIAELMQTF
ncbi:hypothetical protein FNT36_06460 [Hymenobacter setariae]|uniref:Uncharacterized protein n=1 Tax=Hymenobacter setariae TaxID=2594794 RepID=A0A558C4M1_9BACT|nr:hypothetical protein [Hymenobacter setariae]TVT43724.1 hypothetical protein FNT36_06460 [Hymenobacter setariae]